MGAHRWERAAGLDGRRAGTTARRREGRGLPRPEDRHGGGADEHGQHDSPASMQMFTLNDANPALTSSSRVAVNRRCPPRWSTRCWRGSGASTQQTALEQLSVVPSEVELPLARTVLGNLRVLEGAERSGLVEMRGSAVAFRHELSRRAVEAVMPVGARMQANARVLAALLATPDPDLARIVHHAAAAGDDAAVASHVQANVKKLVDNNSK